jgi:hypothetical protein
LLVVKELVGPIGIPDLTALVGKQDDLEARLALEVPPLLNEVDAAVAAVAHVKAARTPSALAAALAWPEQTVRRRLPGLVKVGALHQAGPNSYIRPSELKPLGQLLAVEAKVRDWRAALRQARTYTVWADNYVTVMGALSVRVVDQMAAEVRADKGGLVVDGKWEVRPRNRKLRPQRRLWASEHLVAGLVGDDRYQPSATP